MKLALIVALASNRVIGINNQLPWHLSADLKRFKQLTLGKPILMGRKTHESIGHPLPERLNIVISRNPNYQAPGCVVFPDYLAALTYCQDYTEGFVIGGVSLYAALLPYADKLYLTMIHQDVVGDTYFPTFDKRDWQEVAREDIMEDSSVPFKYSFLTLKKR